MAVAKGQQFTEAAPRQLYIGMAAVKVLAVNPSKKELEKLYGREIENEPNYVTEAEITMPDGSKKKYPAVRITFICQIVPEKNNGIDAIIQHTIFLQQRYRQGSQSGKYQIIDPYGRTAWATKEEIEAKQIPQYANGPAAIDEDYRVALQGEENLTQFIKNLLNIPNVQNYVNDTWVDNPKVSKEDCLVRLDSIKEYFKGNFKELEEIISYQPENIVKICLGVRTTDDGRTHQTTYDGMSFKNAVTTYAKLDADIQTRKAAGGLANSEFEITDVHEYAVAPTDANALAAAAAANSPAAEEAPAEDPWA